jgi:hypothetical protein
MASTKLTPYRKFGIAAKWKMNSDKLTRIPVSADERSSRAAVSTSPPFPEHVLAYALLLSVTFALYSSTLYFDFVCDALYIFENRKRSGPLMGDRK